METINQAWQAAYNHYIALRAASDVLPDDDHQAVDTSVNEYCEAMDRLLALPAPDHAALIVKIDLIADRYQDFALPPELWQIVRSDVARLGGEA